MANWKLLSKLWISELDQFINERRDEKRKLLKKELQEKLKTIRGRKVHEPFPEGAFERLQSNDVWEQVLGYLTEPTDVASAYFACGTFARILKERRMRLTFPKALNVFTANANKSGCPEMEKVCHQVRKNIWLNFRGVSKAWKKTADFELFDHDLAKDDWFRFLKIEREVEQKRSERAVFENEESVDRAMSLLSHKAHSFSIIRCVEVTVLNGERYTQSAFFTKLIELFRAHGKHVWLFYFECESAGNVSDVYEGLCELLQHMPNLKGLNFLFNTEQGRGIGAGGYFPSLPSLEHFSCDWKNKTLLSQIFRNCVKLRSVRLPCGYSARPIAEDMVGIPMELYYGLPHLIISYQFPWPLKHLEISHAMNASRLFPAINHFRETLQHLRIWAWVNIDSRNACHRLDLPHLKEFYMNLMDATIEFGMVFDDLLLLKSLEKVVLLVVKGEYANSKVKLQKYLESGEMNKSNVWQCFPNLKLLSVEGVQNGRFHRPTSS